MSSQNAASSSSSHPNFPEPIRRWHFSKEEMNNAASIKDGYDPRRELQNRQQAARFIQTMGERLNQGIKETRSKISQLCMCSAMIHMHRFYYFHSFKHFDFRDLAAACLFLAGKSEECPRKLEHIVKVWWGLKFPKYPSIPPKNYNDAAELIVTLENIVLQTIAFDLKIDLPHAVVLKQMQMYAKGNKKITEVAYFFATDVLCVTDWAIRYPAHEIAAVCIYIVCLWANHQIGNPDDEKPWYSHFTTLKEETLEEIANEFMSIYESCKDTLKITKFVHKGIIQQPRQDLLRSGGGAPPPTLLPPPPAPPTITRKVDLSDYLNRSNTSSSVVNTPTAAPVSAQPQRESFMPDMNAKMTPSAAPVPATTPLTNGNGEVKEKEKKKHKEHKKDREHRDKKERSEDRERRHQERKREREKERENDRSMNNSIGSQGPPSEKRPRQDTSFSVPSTPQAPSSRHSLGGVPLSSASLTSTPQMPPSSASLPPPAWKNGGGGSAASASKMLPIVNGSCRLESPALYPSALSHSLPPPPPPPSTDELEDGEVA